MAMDKITTKRLLKPFGIQTPAWKEYHHVTKDQIPAIAAENPVPCVVKTPTGGSSVGVVIVKEEKDLEPALCEVLKYSGDILVEQYIEGREFTNAVFLDRALPSAEIIPHVGGYDYSQEQRKKSVPDVFRKRRRRRWERWRLPYTVHLAFVRIRAAISWWTRMTICISWR